jgi:hypothetical protein
MSEVALTWGRALKVWWSLGWRTAIFGSIYAVIVGGLWLAIGEANLSSTPDQASDSALTYELSDSATESPADSVIRLRPGIPDGISLPFFLVAALIGIVIQLWILRQVLPRHYSDFHLAVVVIPKPVRRRHEPTIKL